MASLMILLLNVKITSYGLSHYARAGHMPRYDRMDIFKYCLASYAALLPLVSKCLFYIEISSEFANRKEELENYIHRLFPENKLELYWHRNNYTREWRTVCEQFNDQDIIWFGGNDDHIFFDYSLDLVRSAIDTLHNDPDPYSAVYYSHWPEQMRLSIHYNGELTSDGNFIKFNWKTFDGIRIIKGQRLKKYWQDNELNDQLIYRTDHLYHIGYNLPGPVYAPTRELVRHYDGYSHVGALENIVPPIVIPPGFFDDAIKIRLGYADRKNDWVNLNPKSDYLWATSPDGTDYRWVAADIPLFWIDKIVNMDTVPGFESDEMNKSRDEWYLKSTRIPMRCYQINFTEDNAAPIDWFKNNLRSRD